MCFAESLPSAWVAWQSTRLPCKDALGCVWWWWFRRPSTQVEVVSKGLCLPMWEGNVLFTLHPTCFSQLTLLIPPWPPSSFAWMCIVLPGLPALPLTLMVCFPHRGQKDLLKYKSEILLSCLNPSSDSHCFENQVKPLPTACGTPVCLSKPISYPFPSRSLCSRHTGFLAAFKGQLP